MSFVQFPFKNDLVDPDTKEKNVLIILTLKTPIPQNGQTHSNNSSAVTNELFECVWPFCGIGSWRVKITEHKWILYFLEQQQHITERYK